MGHAQLLRLLSGSLGERHGDRLAMDLEPWAIEYGAGGITPMQKRPALVAWPTFAVS
jgi:hypothetical protein